MVVDEKPPLASSYLSVPLLVFDCNQIVLLWLCLAALEDLGLMILALEGISISVSYDSQCG